jgi:hypothetical protein
MNQVSTRVKLRNAFNNLGSKQEKEKELIERIIQDIKGKDISLQDIISVLQKKKTEIRDNVKIQNEKVKSINRVIHKIEQQNEKPPENTFEAIESGDTADSKKPGDKRSAETNGGKTSSKD